MRTPAPGDPPAAAEGPAPARARLRHMPGIDGLRAVAVGAVLAYHLGASWLPGGFLGVDVFLVISGFLITSLLLAEREARGRIDLRSFWVRRALRLLPALFLMLIVVLAAMVLLHPAEVGRLRGAVLASLGYVANWYFAFAEVPYFEQFGRPSVLQHLWSLAVEEQFYILWPPVLALGLAVLRPRHLLAGVAVAIAASTALAWAMWEPSADPSRIYYGTDTRAVGLLAGVALGLVWPAARRTPDAGRRGRAALDAVGAACLAGVLAALVTLGDLDRSLYQGGFLLVALATAGLVAVAAHPSSRLGGLLGGRVLAWLGVRSYAIYLWHWPVVMLTRPDVDVPLDGPALTAVRLGVIVTAAHLSYRYVERPVRRLGFRGTWQAIRRRRARSARPVRLAAESCLGGALAALVLAVALLPRTAPSVPGFTPLARAAQPVSEPAPAAGGRVLMVGDSVMLGASGELRRRLGRRAVIDAEVARQFEEGAAAVRRRLRGMPKAAVVIHLGSNGYVSHGAFEALMRDLSRRRVVLVTVRVPLRWEGSVNALLRAAASRRRNVALADWHAVSAGPDTLVDGAHATPKGMRLYARAIIERLR